MAYNQEMDLDHDQPQSPVAGAPVTEKRDRHRGRRTKTLANDMALLMNITWSRERRPNAAVEDLAAEGEADLAPFDEHISKWRAAGQPACGNCGGPHIPPCMTKEEMELLRLKRHLVRLYSAGASGNTALTSSKAADAQSKRGESSKTAANAKSNDGKPERQKQGKRSSAAAHAKPKDSKDPEAGLHLCYKCKKTHRGPCRHKQCKKCFGYHSGVCRPGELTRAQLESIGFALAAADAPTAVVIAQSLGQRRVAVEGKGKGKRPAEDERPLGSQKDGKDKKGKGPQT
ncbi:hypothetical protein ACN47E_006594 [Coniothyrium glycines]